MIPTSIDGTDITGATIDGTDVQEITVDGDVVFSAGPASEGFEHNNLSGNYVGNLSAFQIQSSIVDEGSFALEAIGGGSNALIVRTTGSEFNRFGKRIDWKQYHGGNSDAGLAFVDQTGGYSGSNGYRFFVSDSFNYVRILGLDQPSVDSGKTNYSITNNQWLDASVEFPSNGDMVFTFDGQTATLNDTQVTDGYLGFQRFDGSVYYDDIRFSTI